jgi:hypothetical protein
MDPRTIEEQYMHLYVRYEAGSYPKILLFSELCAPTLGTMHPVHEAKPKPSN